MGKATEQLADRMGEGVGGLLNATFGNAAELIIGLAALHAGLPDVLPGSLIFGPESRRRAPLISPPFPKELAVPSTTSVSLPPADLEDRALKCRGGSR